MDMHAFRHYKTNIPEIDEDHQALLEILNEIKSNPRDSSAINLLKKYLALFIRHTQDEEELMLQCSYPFLEPHRQEHSWMRSSVEAYLKSMSGATHNFVSAIQFESQLLEHLDRQDIEFSEFFHSIHKPKSE